MVLTYKFWTSYAEMRPSVIGKNVRLGTAHGYGRRCDRALRPLPRGDGDHRQRRHQPAPSSATMVTGRVHRMTQLFGRLAPGADLAAGACRN